jgi:molybdopterin-guanine dinucleotide biosynthesis protein A
MILLYLPAIYWEEFLKADLENMLQTKRKRHQRVQSESTAITVSVNDRTQSPLENCSSININWIPVEKQLRKWSNLLRIGKRLKITCN